MTLVENNNGERKKDVHSFGVVMKQLRTARHLSQADLAKAANISAGYVGLIEIGQRGERPSLDIVKAIGGALRATVAEMEALMRASNHLRADEPLIQEGRLSFQQFVDSEPLLTQGQKDVLLAMYFSWV